MKILLDTNIIIHREGNFPLNKDVGVLFKWLDNLHYVKCIHQVTVNEIKKLKAGNTKEVMSIKLDSYNLLQVQSALNSRVKSVGESVDVNENDQNDTLLLNELFIGTVDVLVTEDKKIRMKAGMLGVADQVFTIDTFLEKVIAENPGLTDYKVLAVKKEFFGNVNLGDEFFDSFKQDYPGFGKWFTKKSEDIAYVCRTDNKLTAFLYLKIEGQDEPYSDIQPVFEKKRRLKIGTFKVTLNGYRLGERFVKIIFDNAISNKVDEIYVTIFNKRPDQQRLIDLLEEFGFVEHGIKKNSYGDEIVFVRKMNNVFNDKNPKLTYPFFSRKSNPFIVPIYPEYHTN